MSGRRGVVSGVMLATLTLAGSLNAQGLDEFDYENLSFRGVGVGVGYVFPDRVDATTVFGGRFDLGYAGPGFRIVPHTSYWSSSYERSEVQRFEQQLETLITRESGAPSPDVDLGDISLSDFSVGVDGHFVWAVPRIASLTYAGVGMTAHFLNGSGEAITDTFIEDLIDALSAGFNVHAGLEYLLSDGARLFGQGKYELMSDLRYFEVRLGGQIMVGGTLPDERVGS